MAIDSEDRGVFDGQFFAEGLIGFFEREAIKKAQSRGYECFTSYNKDTGAMIPGDEAIKPTRIRLTVKGGRVEQARVG